MNTYFAFIDESGDHGMVNIDPASPMLALTAVVYPRTDYITKEIPSLGRTKVIWWGHEGVIFRSYDIRKKQGPFSFCAHKEAREDFQAELCDVFRRSSGKVISAVIDKQRLAAQYVDPMHPYYLAVQFVLERIAMMSGGKAVLVFESRGKAEDAIVKGWCEKIAAGENYANEKYTFSVSFAKKRRMLPDSRWPIWPVRPSSTMSRSRIPNARIGSLCAPESGQAGSVKSRVTA